MFSFPIHLRRGAFATLIGLGALALPATASATPLLAAHGLATQGLTQAATALPVEQAQSFGFYYSSRRHGPRYRVVRPGYRYYHSGYYYREPYWQPRYRYYAPRRYYRQRPSVSFGLTFGGGYRGDRVVRSGRSAHRAWCSDRYRTYDVRSDTFIARAGGPRVRCRSPY